MTLDKILIPMIRNVYPQLLAQSILGVQPMTKPVGEVFTMKFKMAPQSKYKFSRAKWYIADFEEKYYWEVEAWCTEHFGPHPRFPDAWSRWIHKYESKIHFRDEKDYAWFILRWGV